MAVIIPVRAVSLAILLASLACGCSRVPAEPVPETSSMVIASSRFDPRKCGTIEGQVRWQGDIPQVGPFVIPPIAPGIDLMPGKQVRANPNAPAIDPSSRGVGNAVVYLRGIDGAQARPWDHGKVVVEIVDYRFRIRQGSAIQRYGFVRRGEAIEMVSRQPAMHGIRADGAAFFTVPFPDPDCPLSRSLDRPGVVELTSSVAHFWIRAYLFVDDHPYYSETASDGRFIMKDIPEGEHRLVCWMPNWQQAGRDLDPEFGIVLRHYFRPAVEVSLPVTVRAQETTQVTLAISGDRFGGPAVGSAD